MGDDRWLGLCVLQDGGWLPPTPAMMSGVGSGWNSQAQPWPPGRGEGLEMEFNHQSQ